MPSSSTCRLDRSLIPGLADQSHQLLHSLFEWSNIYIFVDRMGVAAGGQANRDGRETEAERQVGVGGTDAQARFDAHTAQASLGQFHQLMLRRKLARRA